MEAFNNCIDMLDGMAEMLKKGEKGREWRHHSRYALDQWIDYSRAEQKKLKPCYCENISLGGAKVVLHDPVSFGSLLLLHIQYELEGLVQQFEIGSMVVRLNSKQISEEKVGFRVGVQFLATDQDFIYISDLINAIAHGTNVRIKALSLPIDGS